MDEAYLLSCVRYVERLPLANLVEQPQDWPWSSARAHLQGEDDVLVKVAPMLDRTEDWSAYLESGGEAQVAETLQYHTLTGRPLGSERFLDTAERITGRTLRPRKPGRKPGSGKTGPRIMYKTSAGGS